MVEQHGGEESKIQSSMRFVSSFNLFWTIIRVERKRLAETAEQGWQLIDDDDMDSF